MAAAEVMRMSQRRTPAPPVNGHGPLGDLVRAHITRHALTQEAAADQICAIDNQWISLRTLQRILAGKSVGASTARTLCAWLPYANCEIIDAWRRQTGR